MSHLAIQNKLKLPIYLRIDPIIPDDIKNAIKSAISEWNNIRPCFLIDESETSTYNVQSSAMTWVNMYTGILHIGKEGSQFINYWIKHELGHLLMFGDHIRETTNPTGYINPKVCTWPNDDYKGIMSYCYYNNIITEQDKEMVLREYPLNLIKRVRIPGVSRD